MTTEYDVIIVSGDKDFAQLVDENVVLYDTSKEKITDYEGVIEKYTITGKQVIIYFRKIEAGQNITIPFQLKALYPIKAKGPVSNAYQYYQPEIKDQTKPINYIIR